MTFKKELKPELAEKGIKEEDVIHIVKPEQDHSTQVKPSKQSQQRAAEIAEKFDVEIVIENVLTGEFFTSENLALLSVKGDKKKLKIYHF